MAAAQLVTQNEELVMMRNGQLEKRLEHTLESMVDQLAEDLAEFDLPGEKRQRSPLLSRSC